MTAVIPDSPRPARPKKASGQWALGYREPLNANERMKKDDDGLNVRARVERIYSVRGFDSIPGDDLRGRLETELDGPVVRSAGSAGGVSTRSASQGSTAARPRPWSRRSSRTSTS